MELVMQDPPTLFGAREVSQANQASRAQKKPYTGVEQRRVTRRSGDDRREEVRFDLKCTDRREGSGRRADDLGFPTY